MSKFLSRESIYTLKSGFGLLPDYSPREKARILEIATVLSLTKGANFMKNPDDVIDLWDGPLRESGRIIVRQHVSKYATKKKILRELRSWKHDIHPVYTRDFFQGLLESAGQIRKGEKYFYSCFHMKGREWVHDFLTSGDHGVHIGFGAYRRGRKSISDRLPFLEIPPKGEHDKYFAGLLSGSVPVMRDGELWCSVLKANVELLRSLGVIFEIVNKRFLFSSFYIALFLPDMPPEIASFWLTQMSDVGRMEQSGNLMAAMHWLVAGNRFRDMRKELLPFMLSSKSYANHGLPKSRIKQEMAKLRFDYLDKRILDRCSRWQKVASEHLL